MIFTIYKIEKETSDQYYVISKFIFAEIINYEEDWEKTKYKYKR